jgi:hypothetical protein
MFPPILQIHIGMIFKKKLRLEKISGKGNGGGRSSLQDAWYGLSACGIDPPGKVSINGAKVHSVADSPVAPSNLAVPPTITSCSVHLPGGTLRSFVRSIDT